MLADQKNERKATLLVGESLKKLSKFNLLKGSLSGGSGGGIGLYMHDVVRDYVIHQHSDAELRALQRSVVDIFLAARPMPDGFRASTFTAAGTFEGYAARQLFWHFRGALEEGEEPPDAWIVHTDTAVVSNAAGAVGLDAVMALSKAREGAGELVRAAEASWAASLMKDIDMMTLNDLVFRTADLLESANDQRAAQFECRVLAVAFICDIGTPRNSKAQAHMKELGASLRKAGKATFESNTGEALATYEVETIANSATTGHERNLEASLAGVIEHNRLYIEASRLTDNPSLKNFYCGLMHPGVLGFHLASSHLPNWDPCQFGCSEEGMIACAEFYQHHVCGHAFKGVSVQIDYFLMGPGALTAAYYFGSSAFVELWFQKAVAAYKEFDLLMYRNEAMEIWGSIGTAATLYVCGLGNIASLVTAIGFSWDKKGLEHVDMYATTLSIAKFGHHSGEDLTFRCESTKGRLLIILSSLAGAVDKKADMAAWMPSPQEIAHLEHTYKTDWVCSGFSFVATGALAFLKLGRDDDAWELARIGVSPEQKTERKFTFVVSHCILGRAALNRENVEEAERHFASALEEAKLSRLPMLEVVVAREWKRGLLVPQQRDCAAAEAVIDAACATMKKTRGQIARVLAASWYNSEGGAYEQTGLV